VGPPVLYLHGVSTGDFQEALAAILGKDAPNLSPAAILRRHDLLQLAMGLSGFFFNVSTAGPVYGKPNDRPPRTDYGLVGRVS
jgi:hypothetical protein